MENIREVKVEEVVEETTKVGFFNKVKDGVKKHGKKIVTTVAIVGGALAVYALGKKAAGSNFAHDFAEDVIDTDVVVDIIENVE